LHLFAAVSFLPSTCIFSQIVLAQLPRHLRTAHYSKSSSLTPCSLRTSSMSSPAHQVVAHAPPADAEMRMCTSLLVSYLVSILFFLASWAENMIVQLNRINSVLRDTNTIAASANELIINANSTISTIDFTVTNINARLENAIAGNARLLRTIALVRSRCRLPSVF
jgi:hypothetical protein